MDRTTGWTIFLLHCISQTKHGIYFLALILPPHTHFKLFSADGTPLPLTKVSLIYSVWERRNHGEDEFFSSFSRIDLILQ